MYDIFEYDNEIDTLIESKNLKRLIFNRIKKTKKINIYYTRSKSFLI